VLNRLADNPGWRPAFGAAFRMLTLRPPGDTPLVVLRALAVVLGFASLFSVPVALVVGIDLLPERIAPMTARVAVGVIGAVGLGVGLWLARGRVDPTDAARLGAGLFRSSSRSLLAAVAVAPAGLALGALSGDLWVAVGGALAGALFVLAVAPTELRVVSWQRRVTAAGSTLRVVDALGARHRPDRRRGGAG
jgi:hypothetical protein